MLNPLATQQLKNKWLIVSFSAQNGQVISSSFLLMVKLSLFKSLLLVKSHRNPWTLWATLNFHITWVYTGWIPLKLMTAYKEWTE
jgi:hypothetical protein